MAAMMPMIATTISSSIRVNPLLLRILIAHAPPVASIPGRRLSAAAGRPAPIAEGSGN
jgi:hypothetical protein